MPSVAHRATLPPTFNDLEHEMAGGADGISGGGGPPPLPELPMHETDEPSLGQVAVEAAEDAVWVVGGMAAGRAIGGGACLAAGTVFPPIAAAAPGCAWLGGLLGAGAGTSIAAVRQEKPVTFERVTMAVGSVAISQGLGTVATAVTAGRTAATQMAGRSVANGTTGAAAAAHDAYKTNDGDALATATAGALGFATGAVIGEAGHQVMSRAVPAVSAKLSSLFKANQTPAQPSVGRVNVRDAPGQTVAGKLPAGQATTSTATPLDADHYEALVDQGLRYKFAIRNGKEAMVMVRMPVVKGPDGKPAPDLVQLQRIEKEVERRYPAYAAHAQSEQAAAAARAAARPPQPTPVAAQTRQTSVPFGPPRPAPRNFEEYVQQWLSYSKGGKPNECRLFGSMPTKTGVDGKVEPDVDMLDKILQEVERRRGL